MTLPDARWHILLVEDCPEDRELLRRSLERNAEARCTFTETESGEDALEVCRSRRPDCILLDYNLPDIDGLEFLNELVDDQGQVSIPVVMLTGVGNESLAVDALKRGAQDYLVKGDVTPEALHRAVVNAIEKVGLYRRLAEQNKELEQFVYVASHDLKAPLRTISGFCSLLGQKYADRLDEKGQKFLDMIHSGTRQMTQLIDSLLEYSRVGRKERQGAPETVDLEEVMKIVLANLEAALRDSGGRVEVAPLPTIRGWKTGLVQVLQNLVGNAIKFRGERAPVIAVRADRRDADWEVTVADNGIGIDPKYHQEVMTPFRRLHSVSEYEGTGLGLAICKKVVDRHGGRLWVESTPGKGSTFFFTLAAGPAETPAPEPVGVGGNGASGHGSG
jgi:signal transduction histidine kinase